MELPSRGTGEVLCRPRLALAELPEILDMESTRGVRSLRRLVMLLTGPGSFSGGFAPALQSSNPGSVEALTRQAHQLLV